MTGIELTINRHYITIPHAARFEMISQCSNNCVLWILNEHKRPDKGIAMPAIRIQRMQRHALRLHMLSLSELIKAQKMVSHFIRASTSAREFEFGFLTRLHAKFKFILQFIGVVCK